MQTGVSSPHVNKGSCCPCEDWPYARMVTFKKIATQFVVEGPVKRIYQSTEVVVKDCNGFVLVFGD